MALGDSNNLELMFSHKICFEIFKFSDCGLQNSFRKNTEQILDLKIYSNN